MHGRGDGWSMISKMEREDPNGDAIGADQSWLIGLCWVWPLVPGVHFAWRIFCVEVMSEYVCMCVCIREECDHGQSLYLVMIRLFASTATHCEDV